MSNTPHITSSTARPFSLALSSSTSSTSVTGLPEEGVCEGFLGMLDYRDLCAVNATCTAWRKVAMDDYFWKPLAMRHYCLRPNSQDVTDAAVESRKVQWETVDRNYRDRLLRRRAFNILQCTELQNSIRQRRFAQAIEQAPLREKITKLKKEKNWLQQVQAKELQPLQAKKDEILVAQRALTTQIAHKADALKLLEITVGTQTSAYLRENKIARQNEARLGELEKQRLGIEHIIHSTMAKGKAFLRELDVKIASLEKTCEGTPRVRATVRQIAAWSQRIAKIEEINRALDKDLIQASRAKDLPPFYRYFRKGHPFPSSTTLRELLQIFIARHRRAAETDAVSRGEWLLLLDPENTNIFFRSLFKAQYPGAHLPYLDARKCGKIAFDHRFQESLRASVFLQRIPNDAPFSDDIPMMGGDHLLPTPHTALAVNEMLPHVNDVILPNGGMIEALRLLPGGSLIIHESNQLFLTDRLGRFHATLENEPNQLYSYITIFPATNQQLAQALEYFLDTVNPNQTSRSDPE